MKIIKKSYTIPSKRTVCSKCKSILEVVKEDVKITNPRGYGEASYTVECPVCHNIIYDKSLKDLFEYFINEDNSI